MHNDPRRDARTEMSIARMHGVQPSIPWGTPGMDLSRLNLTYATFQGSNLRGAHLAGTNLAGADLANIDLSGANLTETNLTAANLTGANLSGANLQSASLRDSWLRDTNFTNANLDDAVFGGSGVTPEQLRSARGLHPATWFMLDIPEETKAQLLPQDEDTRRLLYNLLDDWEGTLGEAIATAETLRAA